MTDQQPADVTLLPDAPELPELDEVLLDNLDTKEYRIGQLHFVEPVDEQLENQLDSSESLHGGWSTHDRIDMVLHPDRGALLLRDCAFRPRESVALLRDRIRRVHEELVDLQRRLRRRLDEAPRWRGQAIVLGIGIVVHARCPDRAIPPAVLDELVIDRDDLSTLADRLQRLFQFFTTPATQPTCRFAPQLIDDLTESPEWIGNFIDETTLRLMHGESTPQQSSDQAA